MNRGQLMYGESHSIGGLTEYAERSLARIVTSSSKGWWDSEKSEPESDRLRPCKWLQRRLVMPTSITRFQHTRTVNWLDRPESLNLDLCARKGRRANKTARLSLVSSLSQLLGSSGLCTWSSGGSNEPAEEWQRQLCKISASGLAF